ncbi:hypothetical protein J5N97_013711 [Dioscorea zingiberensis]|uniref:Phosphoinositide phospholipase C n=1 Tax=Dioscorea zingiberensis TaxID=325984 RepID=A0A9D5CTH1_9LILI|nr:hypothetical protein J5N97_013711 [Dioscorea zingiberensis]
MGSYKYCICFTRKFRWKEAEPPADVKAAFTACSEGAGHVGPDQLRRFLAEWQKETEATAADAERIVEQVRQLRQRNLLGRVARPLLNLEDFHHFLFSDDLNPPLRSQMHQDMTAPLSHYYIYTGHNSYLTGNQLSSDCSDVPIIKSLQKGVRVIELDIWPNSTKDNIDVLHGRTLTSPVELIKCLKSIKEYAFAASEYPVIITLEDHLTPDLQAKVAEMVTQTFGDMLYYPDTETLEEFPSPESLKRRIILSTKPPKEYLESKSFKNTSINEKDLNDEEAWGKEVPDIKTEIDESVKNDGDLNENDDEDEDIDDDEEDQKLRQNAAPDLSEQELVKAAVSHGADLVRFTQKNLLRIYPKGTRFNSSNYNPFNGWMHGAQMVAFNMQGYGRSLWLMHGFYRANGGCGYVKKPDFLMKIGPHGEVFDPKAMLPVKKTLKVKVYMGDGWRIDFSQTHFDAYSPPDFYTKVGIAGVPADSIMKKTRTIEDDWTPVWNEEFTFPLSVPEIALFRIKSMNMICLRKMTLVVKPVCRCLS